MDVRSRVHNLKLRCWGVEWRCQCGWWLTRCLGGVSRGRHQAALAWLRKVWNPDLAGARVHDGKGGFCLVQLLAHIENG